MRTRSLVVALLACLALAASAQQTLDTTATLQGFVQHPFDTEPGMLVAPLPFEAFGIRTYVLSIKGQSGGWDRFLGRYVETRGRITPDADGRLLLDIQHIKEVTAPGTAQRTFDRGATMRGVITAAVIPPRFSWHDAQGRPSGVNPTLLYTIQNQRQSPIFFVLPTNDLVCVTVKPADGNGVWNYATQVLRVDARRFSVSRAGAYRDAVQLPEDAAPVRGRYVAHVGICNVDDFDIDTQFIVE